MIVGVYLRKSRSDNQGEGIEETLRKHEITLCKFAEEKHLAILQTYKEVVSGDSLYSRPEMLKLLEDVEGGRFDAVLVVDIDRLGRGGMKDQGIILEAFKNSDTKIITPDKTYDLNDDMDEELTEFKTFMSRRELKMITKRLKRGQRQTVNNGGFLTTAPYGYTKGVINKVPSLIINEEEAYFVRIIFKMYSNGDSTSSIADYINNLGAKSRKGLFFSRSTVRYIICNPVYTGKIVWYRERHIPKGKLGNDARWSIENPPEEWVIVDGLHEALIDEETFNRVQAIRQSHSIPSVKKSLHGVVSNPLAGIVRCKNCGAKMQRQGPVKGVPYLLCQKAGCVASAQMSFVEEAVLKSLQNSLERLERGENLHSGSEISNLEKTLSASNKELEKLQAQQNRLYDFLEQGVYDTLTFKQRQSSLNQRIQQVEKQKAATQKNLSNCLGESDKILLEKIKAVLLSYDGSDAKERNRLLKSVIDRAVYFKEKKSAPRDFEVTLTMRTF